MQQIKFNCTECGYSYKSNKTTWGKKAKCFKCGKSFIVQKPIREDLDTDNEFNYSLLEKAKWLFKNTLPASINDHGEEILDYLNYMNNCQIALKILTQKSRTKFEVQAESYRKQQSKEYLNSLPIEELNRVGPNIKIKALKSAGLNTIGEIEAYDQLNLQFIPGIGSVAQANIVSALSKLSMEVYARSLKLPKPSDITESFAELLGTAFTRIASLKIPEEIIDEIEKAKKSLVENLNQQEDCSFFNRLIDLNGTLDLNVRHIEKIYSHFQSPIFLKLKKQALQEIQKTNPPENFNDLKQDYIDRFADYSSIFARYFETTDQKEQKDQESNRKATKYGSLPSIIANKVEGLELNLKGLKVELRGYQSFGAKYIIHQQNTIIGDEMGLGKTIQALAAMVHLKNTENASHFMIVVPSSIVINWTREISQRTNFQSFLFHGKEKEINIKKWEANGGIGITTYATLKSIIDLIYIKFSMLFADEAHYIKNPEAQRSKMIAQLSKNSKYISLLTGTPLENRLKEFVNLVHLCDPTLAHKLDYIDSNPYDFNSTIKNFETEISSVYLRRNQLDVLNELPDCIESEEIIEITDEEYLKYKLSIKTFSINSIRLNALGDSIHSTKFQRLNELLEYYKEEKRKVIVYSFFRKGLELVGELVGKHFRIDGSITSTARMKIIDDFQNQHGWSILVSQIEVGGIGLNLQKASVVIILEPQLKPTTEWQAIKRVHRMGQTMPVTVHRLINMRTVEETLLEKLYDKTELFNEFARESAIKNVSNEAKDASQGRLMEEILDIERNRK